MDKYECAKIRLLKKMDKLKLAGFGSNKEYTFNDDYEDLMIIYKEMIDNAIKSKTRI